MKKLWPLLCALLALALLVSNAFWLYALVDRATLAGARDQQHYETCHALEQSLEVLRRVGATRSRDDVLAAARAAAAGEPFEKGGATWIGWLGFSFDSKGRLEAVKVAWEPFECPPRAALSLGPGSVRIEARAAREANTAPQISPRGAGRFSPRARGESP